VVGESAIKKGITKRGIAVKGGGGDEYRYLNKHMERMIKNTQIG